MINRLMTIIIILRVLNKLDIQRQIIEELNRNKINLVTTTNKELLEEINESKDKQQKNYDELIGEEGITELKLQPNKLIYFPRRKQIDYMDFILTNHKGERGEEVVIRFYICEKYYYKMCAHKLGSMENDQQTYDNNNYIKSVK